MKLSINQLYFQFEGDLGRWFGASLDNRMDLILTEFLIVLDFQANSYNYGAHFIMFFFSLLEQRKLGSIRAQSFKQALVNLKYIYCAIHLNEQGI